MELPPDTVDEDALRRATYTVLRFVGPWELGLAPAQAEVIARCVLRYAGRAELTWQQLGSMIDAEMGELAPRRAVQRAAATRARAPAAGEPAQP